MTDPNYNDLQVFTRKLITKKLGSAYTYYWVYYRYPDRSIRLYARKEEHARGKTSVACKKRVPLSRNQNNTVEFLHCELN